MKNQPSNALSWNLRQAGLSDLTAIHSLYVQTIEYACKNDYDQLQRNVWKQGIENIERWEQAIESQYFLVAENRSGILGFGSLKEQAHVDFLFTHKDHLRKGVAAQIYLQLEREAAENLNQGIDRGCQCNSTSFL
ncbi:GNAT family N-acetyltransferase [Dyadobacter sp. CY327]|uniref:GNAT family N-acetyltransferase n=1 Tax=Dyadobacter sp. CY327 TaxID=2907301 RepID=UPI001F16BF87|nr:GNAT family N-acetyltransferase [Dyadobacter sp. CY327]MCE7072586.1 GNAT family N-acetyltransferase [Dyadobacter sp. CY327]